MFHHTVLMQLSDADEAFFSRVAEFCQRIVDELPFVRAYHFGRNVASRGRHFEWAVISVFDSSEDHDRYQVSPAHQAMKAFMDRHIADLIVCDFDTEAEPPHA
jgi:hypothetical protein